jgi:superfamily II DNA or RNA helicase
MTGPLPANSPSAGLRELDFPPGFDSSDNILEAFYVPALSRAIRYDRSVGYFRSSALAVAARGLSHFINHGGTVRLLVGASITEADRDALAGRTSLDGAFAAQMASRLVTADEVARRRLEVLAWLAREGRLEVRIAIAIDSLGQPLVGGEQSPYFHEKIGVLRDAAGDGVAFQGSVNESETAWTSNFESFSVYPSWDATAIHYSFWANKFEQHWAGSLAGFRVYPLPEAVRQRLVELAPFERPSPRDPEELPSLDDDATVARFLAVAPRLVGAEGLAEATTGVVPYPHQRQVAARLAGQYPRSWLVADEVGLGKTISAGLAIRQLLLSGEIQRALILAPASVCRQWQDELFEKFGLWVPRLDGVKVYGAHPDEVTTLRPGDNPYALHPILIASSHLARRPGQQRLVLDAAPYDLLVVDEAHHARRQHGGDTRYRPSRLLQLLDQVHDRGAARALWLLTATPMQISPVELVDLVRLAGCTGPLAHPEAFQRYFAELAKKDDVATAWGWLESMLQKTPRLPSGPAEEAVLADIRARLGPVQATRITRFGTGAEPPEELVANLGPEGRAALRSWLRMQSPVGQHVTRHSRETLRRYRDLGLLKENLAERKVESVFISFTPEEQALYDSLDDLIDRLMAAHGSRRGAGFVLTVYRRRLTSSWAAIGRTLKRRLRAEQLELEDDLVEEAETVEDEAPAGPGAGRAVDHVQALPLTAADLAEMERFAAAMATVPDSKLDRLRQDLDAARSAGHSTIVFTQFTDTLDHLRDSLVPAYRSQLATFTGDGGWVFRDPEGWAQISKRDLVDAVRARQVTVLLATDAASEGLNLQAASYLINYDMPWNPMRVEQRIGRIDRLGQVRDRVEVRNYFIPGTVEQAVYAALAERIDDFHELLGALQPILGATEQAFRKVFSAPRSERAAAQARVLQDLVHQIDDLRDSGVDISVEDPFPVPPRGPTPVTLRDLSDVVRDRFAAELDEPSRPVTWDPARASRDAEGWVALATYGHSRLTQVLAQHGALRGPQDSALIISGDGPMAAVRADRSPPEPILTLAEIDTLGPPISTGEAESLARRLAAEALASRQARHRAIEGANQAQWETGIRTRFTALIHHVLSAGCAAALQDGTAADPIAVWHDLARDWTSPLAYAEAFRSRLGIPVQELVPTALPSPSGPLPSATWAAERRRAGEQLGALMSEYRSRGVGR